MKPILSFMLSLVSAAAFAQPAPLTAGNSNPLIGEIYYNYTCYTAGVSPGASGAGVTWNFTSLIDSAIDTVWVEACSASNHCDSFPGSTFIEERQPASSFRAYVADTAALKHTGALYRSGTWNEYEHHGPPLTFLTYPLSYGDTWHDTFVMVAQFNLQNTIEDMHHHADAYGTLITPGGTYSDVLRVHVTSYGINIFGNDSTAPSYTRHEMYGWYKPGIHVPLVLLVITHDSTNNWDYYSVEINSGTLIPGFLPTFPAAVGGISEADAINVYPNPAKNILHVKLANAQKGDITISLLDITGRQVAAPVSIKGNSAEVNTAYLSTGIYLLRVQTSEGMITKRIEVTR